MNEHERSRWQVDSRVAYRENQERERLAKEQKDREILAEAIAKALARELRRD